MTGHAPGLDLVIYGCVLVAGRRVRAARHRGLFVSLRAQFRCKPAERAMAEMLRVENVSRRFGGLLAVNRASFTPKPAASPR